MDSSPQLKDSTDNQTFEFTSEDIENDINKKGRKDKMTKKKKKKTQKNI